MEEVLRYQGMPKRTRPRTLQNNSRERLEAGSLPGNKVSPKGQIMKRPSWDMDDDGELEEIPFEWEDEDGSASDESDDVQPVCTVLRRSQN